mgnify:CR=1 FL=1
MDFYSKIIKSIGLDGNPSNHKIAVAMSGGAVSYTHLRAHETPEHRV